MDPKNKTCILPQFLCAVLIILSPFIKSSIALAEIPYESTNYATSFFSLADPERVSLLNRELSEILTRYPTIQVLNITRIPVTSKGKKYFRSIVVTDQKGRSVLEERELEIGNLLKQKALRRYGMTIEVEPWAYRFTEPIPIKKPDVVHLNKYDKIEIAGAKENKRRFLILIRKFASLPEADKFCRKLGTKGIEVILGYSRKITGGSSGREIDPAPFRVFLKSFESPDLVFRNPRKARAYVEKNKIRLQKNIGKGSWNIYDARDNWQLVPKKKHNILIGSFRLDQLPSKEEQLVPYLDALEERGIPFYLTTVGVGSHIYLRVVHAVPDESQLQIDLALTRLTEELNDFSLELGKDFNIHPQKIPQDDPLEETKFTLDDLVLTMSNGNSALLKKENVTSKVNRLPVNVRDLFGGLFSLQIRPLQNDLKGQNMIGLKVIKTSLPGMVEYTCFAIEENYKEKHTPFAEKLKAAGKILTFFIYRQDDKPDLDQLAQLAVKSEIRSRQSEAADIAILEKKEASKRLALEASEKIALHQKFEEIKYIIEKFGYSEHIHPVVLYKNTVNNFHLIDEITSSIDLTDYPDLAAKIKALMWTESSGNSRARSRKNAQGALQVTLNGYLHTRRKFSELIRMAERAETIEVSGMSQAQETFPIASRRLLENAWRLVDPSTSYKEVGRIPRLNLCEGTLQLLIDYVFFSQQYIKEKPKGKYRHYYPYQLRRKQNNYHPDEDNMFDPEIAAMAAYNYGRYGVIGAIKRKGKNFVQLLPYETRRHLANYFVTKLSLDERCLAEYKKHTKHEITLQSPRKPYRFRGKIRKVAQR
jgi:hypothetical protein